MNAIKKSILNLLFSDINHFQVRYMDKISLFINTYGHGYTCIMYMLTLIFMKNNLMKFILFFEIVVIYDILSNF